MTHATEARTGRAWAYAPYGIVDDPASLGLVESRVAGEHGTTVARHLAARTSVRATIFLHGAAGAWTTWTPLLQGALDAGIRIENPVLLDLPGWGDGRFFSPGGEFTVASISDFVKDTVEGLGYTEWDIVGHSLGGSIALHMAAEWPDRVLSVGVVSATTFSVIRSIDRPMANFAELPAFTALWRIMQTVAPFGAAGRGLILGLGAIGAMRLLFSPLFRYGLRVPGSVVRATVRDLRPRAFAAAVTATRGYDAAHWWAKVECPVRAVKGDHDVFVTNEDFAELATVAPGALLTVLDDCGHFGIVERPAAVLVALGFTGAR